jgi:hypothetical protein
MCYLVLRQERDTTYIISTYIVTSFEAWFLSYIHTLALSLTLRLSVSFCGTGLLPSLHKSTKAKVKVTGWFDGEQNNKSRLTCSTRVARWFVFQPKLPIWVNFRGSCNSKSWYILWPFGLLYGHLKYSMAIWYIYFVVIWYIFPPLGILHRNKEKSGNPGKYPFKRMFHLEATVRRCSMRAQTCWSRCRACSAWPSTAKAERWIANKK